MALDNVPRGPYWVRLAPRGAGEETDVYIDFTGDDGLQWSLARVYATAADPVAVAALMAASTQMYGALEYAAAHARDPKTVRAAERAMATATRRP